MKKGIAAAFIIICCACIPITCQCENIATYSDDYVTFDYDTDVYCQLTYSKHDNVTLYYYSTQMKVDDSLSLANIRILNIDDFEETNNVEKGRWMDVFSDLETEEYTRKLISDEDFPEIRITIHSDGAESFLKLLGSNSEKLAIAQYRASNQNTDASIACKAFYDSANVNGSFTDASYEESEDPEFRTIYSNVLLSDQGLNYAKAAIDVLEKYLAFEMTPEEASDQIKSVKTRSDNYADSSDYIHDEDIATALYTTSLGIDLGSDDSVYATLQKLKQLANMG